MEAEPTKVSIKTMKEVIRSAGLATADLLEKRDIEARYKQAQARLEEAERLEREKNQPKKKRRIIEESSGDDDDGGRDSLIPEATGNKKSNVAPFAKFAYQEEEEEPTPWMSKPKTDAEVRRNARKGAAHLARGEGLENQKAPAEEAARRLRRGERRGRGGGGRVPGRHGRRFGGGRDAVAAF